VLRTGLLGLAVVGGITLVSLLPLVRDVALQAAHDDQVHYAGHLFAGRLLSLCPCGAQLAEVQYARAMYHAHTPRQRALLTTQRPTSARARLAEARMLADEAVRRVSARSDNA
jgi:hypothetical protein